MLFGLFGIVLFLFYIFFVSKKLSPVPYFPTNKKDLSLIVKSMNLKNNMNVVDLGAGIGTVIFKVSRLAYDKKLNTKFYAVEINHILIFILYLRKLFSKNGQNVFVNYCDMMKLDLKQFKNPLFFLYLSPFYLEKVYKKIKKEVKSLKIITYFYEIPKIKYSSKLNGINDVFVYSE